MMTAEDFDMPTREDYDATAKAVLSVITAGSTPDEDPAVIIARIIQKCIMFKIQCKSDNDLLVEMFYTISQQAFGLDAEPVVPFDREQGLTMLHPEQQDGQWVIAWPIDPAGPLMLENMASMKLPATLTDLCYFWDKSPGLPIFDGIRL